MDGSSHLEAKLLYRRLDSVLGALDVSRPGKKLLVSFLEQAFRTLRDDLRLRAAVLYAEGREGFSFVKAVGDLKSPARDTLDPAAPPVSLVLQHGVYIFPDPGAEGTPARAGILPRGAAAAIAVGARGDRHLIFLLVGEGWVREELDFALNTVRAALGSRIMEERVRGSFREAAEIQQSLLLDELPEFPGYDMAARSVPAEEVGGDFFDFIPFDGEMLGLAIGDASGHGLPAALLVRDVVTGLRMGIERELKVAPVLTKLNRVIHRSRLSSRFVSVFYGELEAGGNLIYVNAGHQPPLTRQAAERQAKKAPPVAQGALREVAGATDEAHFPEPGEDRVVADDAVLGPAAFLAERPKQVRGAYVVHVALLTSSLGAAPRT